MTIVSTESLVSCKDEQPLPPSAATAATTTSLRFQLTGGRLYCDADGTESPSMVKQFYRIRRNVKSAIGKPRLLEESVPDHVWKEFCLEMEEPYSINSRRQNHSHFKSRMACIMVLGFCGWLFTVALLIPFTSELHKSLLKQIVLILWGIAAMIAYYFVEMRFTRSIEDSNMSQFQRTVDRWRSQFICCGWYLTLDSISYRLDPGTERESYLLFLPSAEPRHQLS
jgi:hypothetical protein